MGRKVLPQETFNTNSHKGMYFLPCDWCNKVQTIGRDNLGMPICQNCQRAVTNQFLARMFQVGKSIRPMYADSTPIFPPVELKIRHKGHL